MCGRAAVTTPHDEMAQIFEARPSNDLPAYPNYNICPTNQLAVVRSGAVGRELVSMRWGFLPEWYKSENDGPLLINARAETLVQKPAFAVAAKTRRCLVPVTGYFEWSKDTDGRRLPWYSSRADGEVMALAAIWQSWGPDQLASCAVVTTASNTAFQPVHHRMPLVLEPKAWALWLGEAGHGAAALMQPAQNNVLKTHRVSRAVNSNRAQGPELIEPFDAVEDAPDEILETSEDPQRRLF